MVLLEYRKPRASSHSHEGLWTEAKEKSLEVQKVSGG